MHTTPARFTKDGVKRPKESRIVYKYSYRPTAEYINNVTEKHNDTESP